MVGQQVSALFLFYWSNTRRYNAITLLCLSGYHDLYYSPIKNGRSIIIIIAVVRP